MFDDLKFQTTRYAPIYQIKSAPIAVNSLPFVKFITKTSMNLVDGELPINQQSSNKSSKSPSAASQLYERDKVAYEKLKKIATECIVNHLVFRQQEFEEVISIPEHPDKFRPDSVEREKLLAKKHELSNQLIKNLMDSLSSSLASRSVDDNDDGGFTHLQNAQYGYDVDVKGYWKRCGFKSQKPRTSSDVIRFQFEDVATFQLKTDRPLRPVTSYILSLFFFIEFNSSFNFFDFN